MKKIRNYVFGTLVMLSLTAVVLGNVKCVSMNGAATDAELEFAPKVLPRSTVAVVQSEKSTTAEITEEDILSMVKEAVALAGGLDRIVKDGDTVVIKPNLVTITDYTYPGWNGRPLKPEANGTTTDWRVTRAVVSLVRKLNPGGKVYVMEGSTVSTKLAFAHHKYTHENIPGVDAFIAIETDSVGERLVKIDLPGGLYRQEYFMNKIYRDADVLISLPCLKNHWHAVVTGAIKNVGIGATPASVYGNAPGNPGRNTAIPHEGIELHRWIRDYFFARPVDFVIMDGLQGCQNGPTPSNAISGSSDIRSDQMNMRLVLASADAVAIDTVESLIMEWDPRTVEYLKLLNADGFGNIDTALIDVRGKRVDEVRKRFAGTSRNFAYRGAQVSDLDAPTLDMNGYTYDGTTVTFGLSAVGDITKLELFIDDKRVGDAVTSGFEKIAFPVPANATTLTAVGYDFFLNATSTVIDLATGKKGDCTAPMAIAAPVIDGNGNDECWKTAAWHPIDELWLGDRPDRGDFSGKYKIVWTKDRLHMLAEITDDIINDTHAAPTAEYYNDDCLEVFLDENASGGDHKTSYNAFAYHVSLTGDAVDLDRSGSPRLYNDHVTMKTTRAGSVTMWELSFKVYSSDYSESGSSTPLTLSAGKKMKFAVAYCDSDTGKERQHFVGSVPIMGADKNVAWITADVFGNLVLRGAGK